MKIWLKYFLLLLIAITVVVVVAPNISPHNEPFVGSKRIVFEPATRDKPSVILGSDLPGKYQVRDAIRIDVIKGVPHTRKNQEPITNLAAHINSEIDQHGTSSVVITATRDEKYGAVFRIIDECRLRRVKMVVLNIFSDTIPQTDN